MGSYVSPDGRRIVKTGSGRTKSEAKAKLKEVLRDYARRSRRPTTQ